MKYLREFCNLKIYIFHDYFRANYVIIIFLQMLYLAPLIMPSDNEVDIMVM